MASTKGQGEIEAGARDIRFEGIPADLVEACATKLNALAAEKTAPAALHRRLAKAFVRQQLALPVVSTTLTRVLALIEREDVAIDDLAFAVESDPALATKVVGVANSGFYGGAETITSVRDALMRTGLREAKNVVAGVAMRSSVFDAPGFEPLMDAIWRKSVATAMALTELLEAEPRFRDEAFLLGLVHDVGRIVLVSSVAVPLAERDQAPDFEVIGQAGDDVRCELGALALASWMFADDMVDAVMWQERPDDCPGASRTLTRALYAADTLVNLYDRGWKPGGNENADCMVEALIEPFGVDLDRCGEILRVIEGGLSAFTKLL